MKPSVGKKFLLKLLKKFQPSTHSLLKTQRNLLILEIITLSVVVTLFVLQLLTLPNLRHQIKSGLHSSQEKIAQSAAEGLDRAFRKEVLRGSQTLSRKLGPSGLVPQGLDLLKLEFRRIAVAQPISNAWLAVFPDLLSNTFVAYEYKSPARYRPGAEITGAWRSGTELCRVVEEKLTKLSMPFVTVDSFRKSYWANALDSNIVMYSGVEFNADILVGTPFFNKKDSLLSGMVFNQVDRTFLEGTFIRNYFNNDFRKGEQEWEGIDAKFLQLGVLSGQGNQVIFHSEPFGRRKYEHIISFSALNSWLPDYKVGVGFKNATVEEVGDSIYARNFYFFITLFLVLAVLLILVFRGARRLAKLSKLKTEFVSNVSHEIKTPLASIRLATDTLRHHRYRNQDQLNGLLNILAKETNRLDFLILTLLDFSQMEAGKRRYKMDVLEIPAWWAQVKELLVEKCGPYLFHVDEPGPSGLFEADPRAVEQVLTILLDNALKYSPETKKIEAFIRVQNGRLFISIRDHGIGIDPKDQKAIFEKFVRIGNSEIHNVKGYGIGLSVAQAIMKSHKGKVFVDSEIGKGSTFTLEFPLK